MNKKSMTAAGYMLIAAALFIYAGCTVSGNVDGNVENTGTVKVALEGPASYDSRMLEANITITEIQTSIDGEEWVTVSSDRNIIDILNLNSDTRAVLVLTSIDPVSGLQVRLILGDVPGDNYVLVDKGGPPEQHELDAPSGPQTGLKTSQSFDIEAGRTTTIVLSFVGNDYTFDPDRDIYRLSPIVTVGSVDTSNGNIILYDDFGYGAGSDSIAGWQEEELASAAYKCSVVEDSDVGGRHARIYGENVQGVTHSFFRTWDLSGYTSGRIIFQAKRSGNWSPLFNERIFFELFYNGAWQTPIYSFNATNIFDYFMELSVDLTPEMMDTEFYVRFRNGLPNPDQYLDIDNFELYGIR